MSKHSTQDVLTADPKLFNVARVAIKVAISMAKRDGLGPIAEAHFITEALRFRFFVLPVGDGVFAIYEKRTYKIAGYYDHSTRVLMDRWYQAALVVADLFETEPHQGDEKIPDFGQPRPDNDREARAKFAAFRNRSARPTKAGE